MQHLCQYGNSLADAHHQGLPRGREVLAQLGEALSRSRHLGMVVNAEVAFEPGDLNASHKNPSAITIANFRIRR